MLLRLACLTVANAFVALRLLPVSDHAKGAEILALRHQITVLERQLDPERGKFAPMTGPSSPCSWHRCRATGVTRPHPHTSHTTVYRQHPTTIRTFNKHHPDAPRSVTPVTGQYLSNLTISRHLIIIYHVVRAIFV